MIFIPIIHVKYYHQSYFIEGATKAAHRRQESCSASDYCDRKSLKIIEGHLLMASLWLGGTGGEGISGSW